MLGGTRYVWEGSWHFPVYNYLEVFNTVRYRFLEGTGIRPRVTSRNYVRCVGTLKPRVFMKITERCGGVRENLNIMFVKKILRSLNNKRTQELIDQEHVDLKKQHEKHMFNSFSRLIGKALIS